MQNHDFAVHGNSRIEYKVKIGNYQYLVRELQKIWNEKIYVILLVVGSLGVVLKQFGKRRLRGIVIRVEIGQLWNINPFSANPTKWSNKLKQLVGQLFECV